MNANLDTGFCSVPEIMLMLRAPGAGWLATLLTAIDEAGRDPAFNARHRAVIARFLEEQAVPAAVAEAARQRTVQFEDSLMAQAAPDVSSAPRLVAC